MVGQDKIAWTDVQATLFFEKLKFDSFWYSALSLAMLTGLRAGELYALRWEDVDYARGLIRVSKAYNHKLRRDKPHTKTGRIRHIPIGPQLKAILGLLAPTTIELGHILPRHKAFDHGEQSKAVRSLCIRAGVPPIRFHDFRALFTTHLFAAGIAITDVMAVNGWTQLSTAQRYLRLSGERVRGLADSITFPVGV